MGAASGKAQFHAVVYQFILHIDDWVSLPDKVHESRALVVLGCSIAVGMDLLKQEGHVGGHGTSGWVLMVSPIPPAL